jgi:hypothetical protein
MGQDNALRELLPTDSSLFSGHLAPIGLGDFHPSPSPGRTAIQLDLGPVQRVLFAALAVMSLELTIGFGGALAGGDDDDGGVDRRATGDGHARLSEPSLVSPEEAGRGLNNIKNRPLFGIGSWLFVSRESIKDQNYQG